MPAGGGDTDSVYAFSSYVTALTSPLYRTVAVFVIVYFALTRLERFKGG